MQPLGVYIHFPYCRARCPYCDFAIHVRRRIPHLQYEQAICSELKRLAPLYAGRSLVSIYFGGGTPSLWEPESVGRVLSSVAKTFGALPANLEVTLEANPDDLPLTVLAGLREAGINRLSIGAQSFSPARLTALGRLHGPAEIHQAAQHARSVGFKTLSFDLIYGDELQTLNALEQDLKALVSLDADHLSVYQLTVEPRTPYGAFLKQGTLKLIDPDLAADMADLVDHALGSAAYTHYEVSSFARANQRAVHNSLYWHGGEWLGLGSSAHSFLRLDNGGERWSNPKNVDQYFKMTEHSEHSDGASGPIIWSTPEKEFLDEETLAREAMWLGLRQFADGVNRAAYRMRHGVDPAVKFETILRGLLAGELLTIDEQAIRLTKRGALLADDVGLRFL